MQQSRNHFPYGQYRNLKLGIVGHGFVGKAVDYGFQTPNVDKFLVDPKYGINYSLEKLIEFKPDLVFICVPTPMGKEGCVDASSVMEAVTELLSNTSALIVIKSTITPNYLKAITEISDRGMFRVVYNPEFLTEKNAYEQYVNPEFQIMGGEHETVDQLCKYMNDYSHISSSPIFEMSAVEASFVKYGINTFLASKVVFFNQLYDSVQEYGCNFSAITDGMSADSRVGKSHMKVPGYDNKRGYGGACFTKDVRAFTKFTNLCTLLEKCDTINNEYRINYEKDDRELEQNVNYNSTN
jgi:UDPglucose 6-dehydrogenase|tara:strand:- start:10689 stop:11576 length:888 start_codon:yes stop_codon:yes gene_type:complete